MANNVTATANHEEIVVSQEATSAPGRKSLKLVRQDRYEVKEWECFIDLEGQSLEVMNYSTFGIAVYSKSAIEVRSEYSEVPFVMAGLKVGTMVLRKVRQESLKDGGFKIAFQIMGEPLNITRINAIARAKSIVSEQMTSFDEQLGIPEAFKNKVFELRDLLERLQESVDKSVDHENLTTNYDVQTFEAAIIDVVSEYLKEILEPQYDQLSKVLGGVNEDQLKACINFFRGKLSHLLYLSPLSKRILEKPLGYAGDFEMMNFIYRNENIGKSVFAKCMHRYYVNHPNARAVRNRASYLFDKITEALAKRDKTKPFRMLSIASGPANEVKMLIERKVDLTNVEIHLLDQDLSALRNAQRSIKSLCLQYGVDINVHYYHKAIRNLLTEPTTANYQMVYSAGLFDYFSEPVARLAGKKMFAMLNRGGHMIIGNFTAAANHRVLMELALDWNLIYRSKEDLMHLFGDLGGKTEVQSEPEEINLFVVVTA